MANTESMKVNRPRRPTLDLHRLEQFVAVVEWGSLTDAAAELKVTQQALSVAIKALEEQLGVTLFVRTRGMRPSPAGRRLYESAQVLLAGAHKLVPDVQAVAQERRESITVGYTPAVSSMDVFDTVGTLVPPDVLLSVERLFPSTLRTRMLAGELDLALRRGIATPEGFASHVIGHHRLAVALRSVDAARFDGTAISLRELTDETLVLWAPESRSSFSAFLLAQCRRLGFDPAAESSRFQGLDAAAAPLAHGNGYSLVATDPGIYFGGRVTVLPLREEILSPVQALWLPTTRTGAAGELIEALERRNGGAG
ncbi:putative LysR family transcriptional regulator [Gordonia hirsuta DSM 44140 = NBRC 16056]|uniref:Putative LysR family transcriptional regulator n=1 Tax=Gordonia hirsuta DSM 44140 = NBRC 16056 TaxID=1121927 RepID=L7LAB5_9ACTN|nr:LysR family transcriptional regulator [Gordonia hirsuta]GAC58075.1 putative LysR family transcriptional regulator [Gordonia hirsuta DSM 44140 = NBRC 16056]